MKSAHHQLISSLGCQMEMKTAQTSVLEHLDDEHKNWNVLSLSLFWASVNSNFQF